jgi:hypothetical protein
MTSLQRGSHLEGETDIKRYQDIIAASSRDNREARRIASGLCEKEYPPGRGYLGHFSVAGLVHEGPRRGSDGEFYNLIIEPV